MTFTAQDIEAEHIAALASLTPQQRRALERVRNARQHARFNGRFPEENLAAQFRSEAEKRTRETEPLPALHLSAA